MPKYVSDDNLAIYLSGLSGNGPSLLDSFRKGFFNKNMTTGIKGGNGVTCNGGTFITIYSSEYSPTTAATHFSGVKDCFNDLDLRKYFLAPDSQNMKQVLMKTVDGRPDENPRSENV